MSNAANPYASTPGTPFKPTGTMQYMRSFHYVFENPNWLTNLLCVAVCILSISVIPVIGQLIATGYQYEVVGALHRRSGSRYPDFDMNKLLDYLVRGFWVFLVGLVVMLAMLPICAGLGILVALLIGAAGAAGGDDGAAIAMIVCMLLLIGAAITLSIAINMLCLPIMLRAGLMQDFAAAFDFGFAKQFIRNTWKEMILCVLFSLVAGMLLMIVGMAMCCIGIYITMSVAVLMQAHLVHQLYEVHLARGGDAIPLGPDTI